MTDTTRYARVRAIMGRASWHRNAPHTATAGTLQGTGTSQAAALDDLGSQLAAACERDAGEPSFAWDAANGNLWVAVPDVIHGGHRAYVVHMDGDTPRLGSGVSAGNADVADAFKSWAGITPVTR